MLKLTLIVNCDNLKSIKIFLIVLKRCQLFPYFHLLSCHSSMAVLVGFISTLAMLENLNVFMEIQTTLEMISINSFPQFESYVRYVQCPHVFSTSCTHVSPTLDLKFYMFFHLPDLMVQICFLFRQQNGKICTVYKEKGFKGLRMSFIKNDPNFSRSTGRAKEKGFDDAITSISIGSYDRM